MAEPTGPGGVAPSIYLDAAATSPPLPEVIRAVSEVQEHAWGNPASLHGPGLRAAEVLERSRLELGRLLGADPDEVVFCSGGTEAAHLAIRGAARALPPGRIVISAVEHPAVVAAAAALEREGWQVRRWPVDSHGRLDLSRLEELLAPPTRLVSLIWGQSEVGTLQPLPAVAAACRSRGVVLHTDAVQCAGHLPIRWSDLPADLLTLSAHKFQGPRGCGLLLHRLDRPLHPLLGGGGQESGLRAGTPAVALCRGTAVALRRAVDRMEAAHGRDPLAEPRDRLLQELLQLPGVRLLGHPEHRLPHHIALALSDPQGRPLPGRSVVRALARRGVAVSSGTACRSGQASPSPVLTAMGLSPERAASGLRLTLGPWLDQEQLAAVPAALAAAMGEAAAEQDREAAA